MDRFISVFLLALTLILCAANGFSMCRFRVPDKKAVTLFLAVTLFCLIVNSIVLSRVPLSRFMQLLLFTTVLPYLLLILLISKDKLSQILLNFWLWITVYAVLNNLAIFLNEATLRSPRFESLLRILLFFGYFMLYNRLLSQYHRRILDTLSVNWWIFSLFPMLFSLLLWLVNRYCPGTNGFSRNNLLLLVIFALMLYVYLLIVYTLRTAQAATEQEVIAQNMNAQIALQKKQYDQHQREMEAQRIFRHDLRHRNTVLLKMLETGDVEGAKEMLRGEQSDIVHNAMVPFCQNPIINAVLTECQARAEQKGLSFSARLRLPETFAFDETELCVILSNLLENSLAAAVSYISVETKFLNDQIYFNIKNDYSGTLKKDRAGRYMTTKRQGTALGLKSVEAMLRERGGMLVIEDEGGVFNVLASIRN